MSAGWRLLPAALGTILVLPALALPAGPAAAQATAQAGYDEVAKLLKPERKTRKEGLAAIQATGDRGLIPWIVDALFFIPSHNRVEAYKALESLAGDRVDRSFWAWVEWVGRQQDLEPTDGYLRFKRDVLMLIDPRFKNIFYRGAAHHIRLEEIVSGGVRLDGIPSLDDPVIVSAAAADYLRDDEKVFGVDLGGEQRAYPLRMLGWHEMLNDTVGAQPVTLSYCTLCGSGILYDARTRGEPYRFGTSGLLYHSNKLMFDRQSWSLWSNLTGRAVVGRAAQANVSLPKLPMTLTTWGAWRRQHPKTTTLALDQPANATSRFDYRPGLADRARAGVSFPVWQKSEALDAKTEIYAIEDAGHAKAYPLEDVLAEGVINDRLGERAIVLIAEARSGAVRIFERRDRTFAAGADDRTVVDQDTVAWRVSEQALEATAGEAAPLGRLNGHVAFWFGWYGFYPHTELYRRGDG